MKIFVDTNVLLDSLLKRVPWHVDSDALMAEMQTRRLKPIVAALTLPNLYYVGRRHVGEAKARAEVRGVLSTCDIVAIDVSILKSADRMSGVDFEDDIQIAAAIHVAADYIVTRDPSGFAASPIPIISPADLVKQLQAMP